MRVNGGFEIEFEGVVKEFWYVAICSENGNKKGIDGGKILALEIYCIETEEVFAEYDRNWKQEPRDREATAALDWVLAKFN